MLWFPELSKLISFLVHQLFGPPKLALVPRRVRRFWGPGITALMNISQKVEQQLDLAREKNKTKPKRSKQAHKETCSSRSDGLQPNVRITLLRERVIIHEYEDSISTWKPMQIYKSFQTVRTRFTLKPNNYIWLLSNPVKSPSFNFPRTCPSSSVEIAPLPPLKNWNENLVLKRNRASKWRERFR